MPSDLTRPIIGIENRTAQEVFDIMCDRFRAAERALAERAGGVKGEWHRADGDKSILLYTLRQDGWRKGEAVMVNDVTVRIEAVPGSETPIEPIASAILSTLTTEPAAPEGQRDDEAVDRFAQAMKAKLERKRAEGRGGWHECSAEYLSELLIEHVKKGDPVDVANLAMMLHQNGQRIIAPEGRQEAVETRIAWEALECIVARADASKLSPIQYEAAEVAAKIARNALEARGEIFPVDFPSGLFPTRPAEQAVTYSDEAMLEMASDAYRRGVDRSSFAQAAEWAFDEAKDDALTAALAQKEGGR